MTSTVPILSRMFRLIVLLAVLLAGCDRDDSGDAAAGSDPAEAQFDLTGDWIPTEPIDCEFSNLEGLLEALLVAAFESPDFLTEEMDNNLQEGDLESDLSAVVDSEWHIDQIGDDLEMTLESPEGSDVQLHGTVMGDQVHLSQSEEQRLQAFQVHLHTEISGTVLDEDRMVLTQASDLTLQTQDGEAVSGEISCTLHAARRLT